MEPLVGGAGGEEEGGEDSLAREPVDRAEGRLEDSLLRQEYIISSSFLVVHGTVWGLFCTWVTVVPLSGERERGRPAEGGRGRGWGRSPWLAAPRQGGRRGQGSCPAGQPESLLSRACLAHRGASSLAVHGTVVSRTYTNVL